jgi:seryl-tRNA synthetase
VKIKSDCEKNVGAVQVRFCHCTSVVPSHQPNCTAVRLSQCQYDDRTRTRRNNARHRRRNRAIAQLATSSDSDRRTVATLTTTNAKLATQLEAAKAQIAQLKDEIAALKIKIKPAWQGQRPIKTTNNDSYCWSHGYQVVKSHTSATCNTKKSGHEDAANKNNPMGGVQWGKE